jgi:hypothetical protein
MLILIKRASVLFLNSFRNEQICFETKKNGISGTWRLTYIGKALGEITGRPVARSREAADTPVEKVAHIAGIKYPLMRLVDMCFWEIGAEISEQKQNAESELVGYGAR